VEDIIDDKDVEIPDEDVGATAINYRRLDREVVEQDEEELARYLEQRYKDNDYADYADVAAGWLCPCVRVCVCGGGGGRGRGRSAALAVWFQLRGCCLLPPHLAASPPAVGA
jgi:hypothetical protein